jgi:hypothetical protein
MITPCRLKRPLRRTIWNTSGHARIVGNTQSESKWERQPDPPGSQSRPVSKLTVRNLADNGEVWTGVGEHTRRCFPDLKDLQKADYPAKICAPLRSA